MNKVVGIVAAAVVAAGGYFGAQALGLLGVKPLSAEEISTVLEKRAKEINDSGDLAYDGWSRLTSAVHVEKQLTVRGKSILPLEKIGSSAEEYLESRKNQAANFLCNDDTMKAALAGGARFVYQWEDADGENLGMFSARGADYCADAGY